jgi:S1-C subfamily serine protease
VAAALAGGVVALGGAALLWDIDSEETPMPETPEAIDVGITGPSRFPDAGGRLSIGEIYERSRPAVVRVSTTAVVQSADPFSFVPSQEQTGLGSGFVIDKSGYIVTNYHVIEGASTIKVSFSNNESLTARVVGRDPSTDIAVLKIDADSRALTPLALGNSDGVRVGDEVVAIGNPLGYERTVTAGIVSAVGREIQAPNQYLIDQVIQTDAAINQGNSGGPLINASGRVIGVNTQIATGNGGNVGLGFAVPINTVRDVVSEIIDRGRVEHAELGIRARALTPEIAQLFRFPVRTGLLVAEVFPDTGAARAGVRGGTQSVTVDGDSWIVGGDILVAADGRRLTDVQRLRDIVSAKEPGDSVKLDVRRNGKRIVVTVKLGRQPSSPRG